MPPVTLMIKPVSSLCNMRCRYCFYHDVASHRDRAAMGRMNDVTLDHLVRRALRYADHSATFVFQGGEPTLAGLRFYQTLVRLEKQYNTRNLAITNAVQTNGYDISDELLDLFSRERFLLGVSFDGTPEYHDSMRLDHASGPSSAQVMRTIKRMQDRQIDFNILCVVNKYVARAPEEVFRALAPYRYIQFIPCIPDFDGQEHDWSLSEADHAAFLRKTFDLYYRAFRSGKPVSIRSFDNYISMILGNEPESCAMSGRCALYWLIEADGSVYPCDFYVLDEWRMGNINESSFFALAKSPVQRRFLDMSLPRDVKCQSCEWLPLCRGGCRRDREPFRDGQPHLNIHCESYRSFFSYAYPRMREMAMSILKARREGQET